MMNKRPPTKNGTESTRTMIDEDQLVCFRKIGLVVREEPAPLFAADRLFWWWASFAKNPKRAATFASCRVTAHIHLSDCTITTRLTRLPGLANRGHLNKKVNSIPVMPARAKNWICTFKHVNSTQNPNRRLQELTFVKLESSEVDAITNRIAHASISP